MSLDRRAYIAAVLERMRGPQHDSIVSGALDVVGKWAAIPGTDPKYMARWRELLAAGPDRIAEVVLADTEEAEELRHFMPFAGALPNAERWALIRS